MAQNNDSKLMILFVGGLFVVTLAMIVVIFIATRRPVVVILPQGGQQTTVADLAATGAAAGTVAGTPETAAAAQPLPEVPVIRVSNAPSVDDPLDATWNQVTQVDVPLEPQLSSEPVLELNDLTVASIGVQAVRDNQRYVWRISWEQPNACYRSNVGEFSDAVALQFPMKDGAPYTMGGPDMPVTMLYWKALWQKDIDEGFQDVSDVYPNLWNDLYWFANTTGPQDITTGFDNESSRVYMTGRAVGNPMSNIARPKPLEELTAHGFGSSTHVSQSTSNARGTWKDGFWYVVFDRPVDAADPLIARFNQNPDQQLIAFAIWDGNTQNRGGRKHITNWIPMRIAP